MLITAVSLAAAPVLAYLLHVAVLAAAIITIQMVVAIPLAVRQGALLGRHRFEALGLNLVIEGIARFALGALAGIALGVTGLALGLCAGTVIALLILPRWQSDVSLVDRPRTSLTATSASLALLGLFVQLDVLVAPSILAHNGASSYDLAAVPSKGVYLALLAIGPLIFPSVRGRPDRRLVLGAAFVALAFGTACAGTLVLGRHLIADVLSRTVATPLDMGLLGLAMALAGVTGITISAGIARGAAPVASTRDRDRRHGVGLATPADPARILVCRPRKPSPDHGPLHGQLHEEVKRSVNGGRISDGAVG